MINEQALNDVYFTDKELADRYKVSRATIWRWLEAGKLPSPVKFPSGATRWKFSTLEIFEKELPTEYSKRNIPSLK